MKSIISSVLNNFGIGITSAQHLANLKSGQEELSYLRDYVNFQKRLGASNLSVDLVQRAINLYPQSTAQLHQDLIALIFAKFKSRGYFVEFGATDGKALSNTFLMENVFNWSGILAEPGKNWHSALSANRSAIIETKCVWSTSGENLEFNETKDGELSTLQMFSSVDMHAATRASGQRYYVETISLNDLLETNNAPKFIDYLSIDTEGSEFEILRSFKFDKYSFGFISCEHNFTQSREQVFHLLTSYGYERVLEDMSRFDDWYVPRSLIKTQSFI